MRKQKKHIVIVSQCFYPEQFRINDIAIQWKNKGYEVTAVTAIPNYPYGKFYKGYSLFKKRTEDFDGIKIIHLPIVARGNSTITLMLNYLSFIISGFFWSKFTKLKADYVFNFETSPFTQALVGVWFAKRRKIPFYIYVQDLWPENVQMAGGINNPFIINKINKMVDYIYSSSKKILVTSNSFKKNIERRGVPSSKVVFFPQYAESFYKPSEIKSPLINKSNELNIIFTGNIGTAQGLEILPKVASLLKKDRINVCFNIVGDGRNKNNLVEQIKDNNVEEYFNLIDFQPAETIPSLLSSCDCAFLSFANFELYSMTIPAKLQSYLACGIPVIACAEGETKKIIEESQCGFCTNLGNVDLLKDSILKFMKLSKEDRTKMCDNALLYSKKNFNKDELINISMDILFDGRRKLNETSSN